MELGAIRTGIEPWGILYRSRHVVQVTRGLRIHRTVRADASSGCLAPHRRQAEEVVVLSKFPTDSSRPGILTQQDRWQKGKRGPIETQGHVALQAAIPSVYNPCLGPMMRWVCYAVGHLRRKELLGSEGYDFKQQG